MDLSSIVGIVVSFVGLLVGYLLEGHFDFSLLGSLLQPSAAAIVFGGTIGAVLVSFPLSDLSKLLDLLKVVFTQKQYNEVDIINQLAELSEKARKDGLLSLEQDAQTNENEFIRKGLALVVDGIETEVIKDILEREAYLHEGVYESGAKIFEAAGGFSPTMGVLGTVMGMVSILKNLTNPEELGPKISVAFVATLYGVAAANLLWLPFANKIKVKAEREKMISDLIIEGLLSIQAGENPRIIKEKLNLSLLEKMSKKGGSKQEAKEAEG
ncbi:MAG: flagellar motor protein [Clostridiales bacterium]|jgi:chemotaxis protein MotA|nr:flagellar motor protein [Eubacteriales bacterium]MDH7566314.1 flagellar motor protein [Clostridiales bacterium]